ncbi:polyprenol monophosphomannose synthase [Candidatus Woesearchaeota archaeon]|nr:polyprenol monophosphomannose synthase [Candidatus Woesearchaeota archaeon]
MNVCVILPTYNERENVKQLVPSILRSDLSCELHVLVVDDNSPDCTADEIRYLQKTFQKLHLLQREKKQGLGAAYIAGFKHALATLAPDVLLEMDADFSHDPADIPRLLAAIRQGAGLAIGSRYIPGGGIVGWNRWRRSVSGGGNLVSRMFTRLPVKDCTAGFRAWRASTLRSIDLDSLGVSGYAFQISILHAAWRRGCVIKEVPVKFTERRQGTSKLGWKDIAEFFMTAFRLAFLRR